MIYVVFAQPSKELQVRSELEKKGFEAYVPRRELLIHKSGLWTKIINIIFPGYVFVEMDYSSKNHIAIAHTDHVLRILGTPSPLPEHEADVMHWLFNGGKVIEESTALIDQNGDCIGYEGFLAGYEDRVTYFNRRQKKATVEVKFGGRTHKANLGITLKAADTTGQG
ncbi:MAG: transcription termination/antitermination NusG family protein [Oscillospiraceae bacterium]